LYMNDEECESRFFIKIAWLYRYCPDMVATVPIRTRNLVPIWCMSRCPLLSRYGGYYPDTDSEFSPDIGAYPVTGYSGPARVFRVRKLSHSRHAPASQTRFLAQEILYW
jgi:hypothetical protein